MATAEVEAPNPAATLPDYVTNPNAILGDKGVAWRYGRAPDYSNTRKFFNQSEPVQVHFFLVSYHSFSFTLFLCLAFTRNFC